MLGVRIGCAECGCVVDSGLRVSRCGTDDCCCQHLPVRVVIVGTEPVFTVTDVRRAVDHYQRLGFSASFHDETYAFAHRDGLTIHLAHRDEPGTEGPGALYLHVDDADQLADEWRRAGMRVSGPEDFDYGKREGSHTDPDGNKIRFGSPLEELPRR